MSTIHTSRTPAKPARAEATTATRKRDHRFYMTMACALAFGVFAGFAPTYYAKTYFHGPPVPFWVQVHGAVFTAWMLLYLLQNLLAMTGGMKLHRNLGVLGGILSGLVFIFGCAIAVRQGRQHRWFPFPDVYSMLAISFGQMLLFAAFVSLGLLTAPQNRNAQAAVPHGADAFLFSFLWQTSSWHQPADAAAGVVLLYRRSLV